jgi:hypothetical protein
MNPFLDEPIFGIKSRDRSLDPSMYNILSWTNETPIKQDFKDKHLSKSIKQSKKTLTEHQDNYGGKASKILMKTKQ